MSKPSLLLANKWEGQDPTGWWMSEKLDGVRAYWDGEQLISRLGNNFHAPSFFTEGLPKSRLDGELWLGRHRFQETLSVVKNIHDGQKRWANLHYLVFDTTEGGRFETRMLALHEAVSGSRNDRLKMVHQTKIASARALKAALSEVVALGGEGLMLREPGSLYVGKRSGTLLKVKEFHDAEAIVIGHVPGEGRHKGRLGALLLRLPDGKTFKVGTGFSDREREAPPKIGAKVTYSFTELTDGGIPKCAGFVAVRDYE